MILTYRCVYLHRCIDAPMHRCIYAYMHKCILLYALLHLCILAYAYMHIRRLIYACVNTGLCIYAYMHINICIDAYTHMGICTYACMHITICIYYMPNLYFSCKKSHDYIGNPPDMYNTCIIHVLYMYYTRISLKLIVLYSCLYYCSSWAALLA